MPDTIQWEYQPTIICQCRETPEGVHPLPTRVSGPRVILRDTPDGLRGTCWLCGAEYVLTVSGNYQQTMADFREALAAAQGVGGVDRAESAG